MSAEVVLNMKGKSLNDSNVKGVLAQALKVKPHTTIDLSDNKISDAGIKEIAEFLASPAALDAVRLDSDGWARKSLTPEEEATVATSKAPFTAISSLDFSNNKIGPEGAFVLAKILILNPNIKQIVLSGNEIGDKGACAIAGALRTNRSLVTVDVRNNGISFIGIAHFAKAIRINKSLKLKTLALAGNKLDDIAACALAGVKKDIPDKDFFDVPCKSSLDSIDISGMSFGFVGARAISYILENNDTIGTLSMNENNIGAEGARVLSESLIFNTTLHTLNMNGSWIGDDGAGYIAWSLSKNKGLKQIDISGNGIGDDGALLLAKALVMRNAEKVPMPQIEVIDLQNNALTPEFKYRITREVSNKAYFEALHV